MCSSLRKNASIQSVISYTEPKLHTGKTWYIDFTAYDPLEQKMKRKKYMLDGIPKLTDRRRRANEIITNLNVSSVPDGIPGLMWRTPGNTPCI